MAGIYIHIPFCRQKCHYCNFFSVASARQMPAFVPALISEMESRRNYLEDSQIHTVYFGGGTPSLMNRNQLQQIFEALHQHFDIATDAEITLEANPDDIDSSFLSFLKQTPVNRLSIGVQSFFAEDLVSLNRNHSAGQAQQAIRLAQDAGFDRLTIDLIYGIPGLTEEKWLENLRIFLLSGVTHLSAYALTVESKTALAHLIRKGKMPPVDENASIRHFEILLEVMEGQGFVHYEISNFARPGHYSRHNSLYWLGGHYLGLGPSAHSFNGISRQWNVSNLTAYIQQAGTAHCVEEKEVLTKVQQYNEYVMTSLRTSWGCDTEHIGNVFGHSRVTHLHAVAAPFLQQGQLRLEGRRYFLTSKGKLFADGIAAALFLDETS